MRYCTMLLLSLGMLLGSGSICFGCDPYYEDPYVYISDWYFYIAPYDSVEILAEEWSGRYVVDWDWDYDIYSIAQYYQDDDNGYYGSSESGFYIIDTGTYYIDAEAENEFGLTDSDYAMIRVLEVQKIQYDDPDTGWTDVPNPLYVNRNTTVTFKAIPNPSGASWPGGKPVWGGNSGTSGAGSTKAVQFTTASTSTSDYKTVSAECGNTVTAGDMLLLFSYPLHMLIFW